MGEIWQDFIRKGIHPVQLLSQVGEPISIEGYVDRSAKLRQDFNDRLMVDVTIIKEEEQLKVLVYGYQAQLGYFINTVFEYLDTVSQESHVKSIYEVVVKDLEANLAFMQLYFTRYFDFQSPVPISLRNECKKAIVQLDDQLTANRQLNLSYGDLHPLLLTILNHHAEGPVSFVKYYYLTQLEKKISAKTTSLFPSLFDAHLVDFCVVQNVNAPEIITYLIAFLAEKMLEQETMEEKKEWLGFYQKKLNQFTQSTTEGLLPGDVSVRDSLSNWLEQENQYLAVQKKDQVVVAVEGTKLNTSVSVPVLALFTRLFKESGIITNVNLQEIFRFVATNYTTQKKESISAGNLHGKYYKVEESTKRKVTDLLLEMVKGVKRIP